MDLRLRVLRDADAGLPSDELAEKYSVSRAWVDRLKQRRRETGEVAPRKQTRWRPRILHAQLTELAALIREDRTLAELQEALRTPASLPIHVVRSISRARVSGAPRRRRSIPRALRTDLIRRYGRGLSGARVPDHTPVNISCETPAASTSWAEATSGSIIVARRATPLPINRQRPVRITYSSSD